MKKICLLLFTWLIASIAAVANVVIFDPAADVAAVNTEPPFIIEKEGITVTISAGMVNNGSQYRVYKGATITICSSMCEITNIEFQCTAQNDEKYGPGNFVVNTGSYSYEGYVGEWQGNAMCVTFTAEKNQVRITKIIVTYDCNGVVKPVISPASGTYYHPIEVSITCPNNDAAIHYTTNGTDPTAASPQYSAPFTLSTDATIKAVSILDDETSEVAIASYELIEPTQISTLADALQTPDGTTIFFPNPLIALAQFGPRLFVKDETAYALIYGNCGQTYSNGDIIPGGFYFTKSFYAGEPEFKDPRGFKHATEHIYVEPEEIEDLLGHDLFGHYVVLHDVTIINEDNQYFAVDVNGNKYAVYFGLMGVSAPTDLTKTFDLYAIVGSYGNENTIYQLLPVKLEYGGIPLTLCDMFEYPDEQPITFDHEAYVIYQYNRYLYLMDECGYGVIYGNLEQTYSMGDVIPPGWGGTKTTYNGEPEIKNPTGFQPASRKEDITPLLITIPQVGHLLWAHYVELRNVYIDQENMLIRDQEGNTVPYYPQLPYQVDPTQTYDILAIITSYKRTETIYQLFIINTSCIIPPPPGPCCLTDLYEEYAKGQTARFECPLTVIYHNSPYLYVKDSCGDYGLIYSNKVGGPFQNGDQIIGDASWTTYQNSYQLSAPDEWEVIGRTDTIEPVEMLIEDLSINMVHWYIRLKDVHISFDDYSPCAVDETGSLTIYDKFNAEVIEESPVIYDPCDVNRDYEVNIADVNALIDVILNGVPSRHTLGLSPDDVDPEKTYDVDGFLTVYREELEIYPVRITRVGASYPIIPTHDRYDVNGDGEITISDVNCIIDIILNKE